MKRSYLREKSIIFPLNFININSILHFCVEKNRRRRRERTVHTKQEPSNSSSRSSSINQICQYLSHSGSLMANEEKPAFENKIHLFGLDRLYVGNHTQNLYMLNLCNNIGFLLRLLYCAALTRYRKTCFWFSTHTNGTVSERARERERRAEKQSTKQERERKKKMLMNFGTQSAHTKNAKNEIFNSWYNWNL